jgi:hypothetical protein
MMATELSAVRDVLENRREHLLSKANVVATGVGYKISAGKKTAELSIMCSVASKVPSGQLAAADLVPAKLDGVLTDVVRTGRIRALPSHTDRLRPAPGGISIGHVDITAGTLGCLVKKNGQTYILSNNHVLANSNAAQIGDPIIQPGNYDGGRFPDDHIANLEEFVAISFAGGGTTCPIANGVASMLNGLATVFGSSSRLTAITTQAASNLVDAAIAKPINPQDVSNDILEIGTIQGTAQGNLGMALKKSGRTTGLTTGSIDQIDVTVNVSYGASGTALFTDQLMAGAMSAGGDSGSAVLNDSNQLVGLLFAGSDTTTIINRIEHVFQALNVSL